MTNLKINQLRNAFNGPEGQEDMPFLLTPGPLTTSRKVKLAMLADWGSRDIEFRGVIADIRAELLRIAGNKGQHECVIMQGAGTFAIEAALGAFAPRGRRLKTLVAINGAYGERAARILARIGGRPVSTIVKAEDQIITGNDIKSALDADPAIALVFAVHCETTSGIINPIEEIARVSKELGRAVMIDAMSSFGALDVDVERLGIDVMVSSSNKCIEGVPGFSYVICRRDLLEASKDKSHSIVLDLYDQWTVLEKTGQFRFTPPTHSLVAFHQALKEHRAEGGVAARGSRYSSNRDVLLHGMRKMGFKTLLPDEVAGPIIQTFLSPDDPLFNFEQFYEGLRARGYAIYPGKLTKRDSFRIGTIGKLDRDVMNGVLEAIASVLKEMGVKNTAPSE